MDIISSIEDQGEKHVEALKIFKFLKQQKSKSTEDIFQKELQNDEIKKELDEIKI